MAIRQIILDTETTGISVEQGHRIIEIGCVELVDRKLTGNEYHKYINPGREVEEEAIAVHGITNEFLQDKPVFKDLAKEIVEFISGSELIIHNAPFDLSFLNYELSLTGRGFKPVSEYCKILDTLVLARKIHVGQRNSLDALCKRYGVDNTKRDLHGALLDSHLLAQVYLAMTGGQGSFFDQDANSQNNQSANASIANVTLDQHNIKVIAANAMELGEHEKYLDKLKKKGKCIWLDS